MVLDIDISTIQRGVSGAHSRGVVVISAYGNWGIP